MVLFRTEASQLDADDRHSGCRTIGAFAPFSACLPAFSFSRCRPLRFLDSQCPLLPRGGRVPRVSSPVQTRRFLGGLSMLHTLPAKGHPPFPPPGGCREGGHLTSQPERWGRGRTYHNGVLLVEAKCYSCSVAKMLPCTRTLYFQTRQSWPPQSNTEVPWPKATPFSLRASPHPTPSESAA